MTNDRVGAAGLPRDFPIGMSSPALPPHRTRKRLWKVGGMVGAFVLTMVIGNFFIAPERAVTLKFIGHDFLAFYFAGTCVRTGRLDLLYDLEATYQFETHVARSANLELGPGMAPWWNPPFAAWLFAPLSALPYPRALLIWWIIGAGCLGISLWLMCRMIHGGWRSKLLVPLFVLISMPFYQAFSHGQNTFLSLCLLCVVVTLWRGLKPMAAGLVCGLLFYKPQLGLVVALVLCVSQGRRAILGVAITGAILLLINVVTMPGTIHEFLTRMPVNMHWMQEENHYRWERHITLKGFWRLAIQGWAMGPTAWSVRILWGTSEAALLAGLGLAALRTRRSAPSASQTDRLIAASIAAMPLLMPFYFDYDLLLISVAAVVHAADRQRDINPIPHREDEWMTRVGLALFITLEFGVILAGHTRFHPIVALLAAAATLLIRRALRPQPTAVQSSSDENSCQTIAMAA